MRETLQNNKLVADTIPLLNYEIKKGKRILVEDASSSSLDIDSGLYPYTDAFNTTTGAVCTGLGVPEECIETTIGVFSCVSAIRKDLFAAQKGFPTQINEEDEAYESIEKRFS